MAATPVPKGQYKSYTQTELFAANMLEWPVKDDLASMEFPLFSLSKRPYTKVREYVSPSTQKRVKVIPSVLGAATVFDKDLLLYVGSQIIEARQAGLPISRTVKIDTYAFLTGTERDPGGKAYDNMIDMLRRLKGTTIETNIATGGEEETRGFGWIEDYTVTRRTKNGRGVIEVVVIVAEWLYKAFLHYEVLTIDRRYFLLTQSLERRLYELARKHAGDKAIWKCDIEIMRQKSGSIQTLRHFRSDVRDIIRRDALPDYRVALDSSKKPHRIVFYTRDSKQLTKELQRIDGFAWFEQLERQGTLQVDD
ncbi:replication initiator protein A (plasmid) [Xanthomonas campestris pv. olitorii]|uniref:replication initiator protein A n=1 Tax=Xanthomonas TaxID=338 RepID=UPI0009385CCA|nr:replication initiator protein A [Xanthomonas euvesicatoria]WVK06467.1 replication initiator protein A [Xanthomonas campestris pv. olitorii]APO88889.1 Replication initiator protein A [Xanthomonas euvesicatoria]MCC8514704.1 replication initiator protein A [Xanthomonas euvesicatoria pv. euvesicatoria]MCC8547766.1 replication initiator protein A [Xanthomonas euvesicatoria pv. euvesicatoria]MCC8612547.1 replication initiator protein A [Xanthomonas euvesicatoria pv. euvesicatoria]